MVLLKNEKNKTIHYCHYFLPSTLHPLLSEGCFQMELKTIVDLDFSADPAAAVIFDVPQTDICAP